MMRNIGVAIAWHTNQSGCNGRKNYRTDGQTLWSYAEIIGITLRSGKKVLIDYRRQYAFSQTTSRHINLAINAWVYHPTGIDMEVVSVPDVRAAMVMVRQRALVQPISYSA